MGLQRRPQLLLQHQLPLPLQLLVTTTTTRLLLALMTRLQVTSRVEASCALPSAMLMEAASRTSQRTCRTQCLSASSRIRTLASSTVASHAASLVVTAHPPHRAPPLLQVCACTQMALPSTPPTSA